MNLKPLFRYAAALAAVAAAAAVCVVAASFALYAVAREYVGPAGGAAAVAATFALIALIVAWLTTRKVTPRLKKGVRPDESSLIERLIVMAKAQPLVALGAAAAAATATVAVVVRNPAVITAIVTAILAGNAQRPPRK